MDEQKKILESNRIFHNRCAFFHDEVNSYIIKNSCREFYENLFLEILTKENINIKELNVLELGCGTANFLKFLFARDIAGYTGIDISEGMIDRAKKKALGFSFSNFIDFKVMPAENFAEEMKTANKKFDIIFSCSFLHHLFNPTEFLSSIQDILAPGGIYIALHEPDMLANGRAGVSRRADALLAYLCGYDTTDGNFLYRIGRIVFFPFRVLARQLDSLLNKSSHKKNTDYVDYQLNSNNFCFAKIANINKNNGILIYEKHYSYFVFDFLNKISKSSNNHFYLVMKKNYENSAS